MSLFHSPELQRFEGTGQWKNQCGLNGDFRAQLTFQDNELIGKMGYKVPVGLLLGGLLGSGVMTYRAAAVAENNGMFQLTGGRELKEVNGNGYCFRNVCHIEAGSKGTSVEEMFYLVDNDLYFMGSKMVPELPLKAECKRIAFSAKLTKVN